MKFKILDCTLRDGGYYTNWDFDEKLVDTYIASFNELPVEYLEIGYRSHTLKGYLGQYFYLPDYVMRQIKEKTNKKLVIILNEKDVRAEDAEALLRPCMGLIDMVRLAIDPKQFERAIGLATAVKKMGFEVGFNVMYMSTWAQQKMFLELLPQIEGIADYFYMVDSYGGVYPEDVRATYELVRSKVNVKIGFHAHNNLELGLINTLTALECGADIVDVTITGMGRGAGNLKTELLLTALNAKGVLDFDFNALSKVVDGFTELQKEHEWGTNLPYMVSGANSLPQKDVMDWVGKRYYSFNSIIRALSNQSKGLRDNVELEEFAFRGGDEQVLIIGGGNSVQEHVEAIHTYLENNPSTILIHSSSRNVPYFKDLQNKQYHCLAGNEGYRLETTFNVLNEGDRAAVLPPYPRPMGTYIPKSLLKDSYQLKSIDFTEKYKESITSVVLQLVKELGVNKVMVTGYDGYKGDITKNQLELFNENEYLFGHFSLSGVSPVAITPTTYNSLEQQSIYSLI